MAKHILYSDITSTAKQPYLKQTHQHYNEMTDELMKAFGETIVSDSSLVTILWGCVNTGTGTGVGQSSIISAGAVYYNGEVYQVPAFTTASIVNGLKGTITTAYTAADPVLFSDSTTHNVHQIKTMVISDATGGFQYSAWASIKKIWGAVTLTDSDVAVSSGTVTLASASSKILNYNIDYKSQQLFIDFKIVGAEVSASTLQAFYVKLPLGITQSSRYTNMGWYINTNNTTSEAASATKQTTTLMHTNAGLGTQWIQIAPFRQAFEQFDTDGTNNLSFYGQITIPFGA